MDGNIEITKSNSYFFLDSIANNMIIYTSDQSQHMLLGTQSNNTSAVNISTNSVLFNRITKYTCNAIFLSNIGFDTNNPKASIHTMRDIYIDSNDMPWTSDHGCGLYMRYSTFSNENASYIQSILRDGSSNIQYQNMYIQFSNLNLVSGSSFNTEKIALTVNQEGNVGINTTDPIHNFDVNGNIYTRSNIVLNSNYAIIYGSNIGEGYAGRIGYSIFNSNSLDIVGAANSNQSGRVVTFYINSNHGAGQPGKAIFNGGCLHLNNGSLGIGTSNTIAQFQLAKNNSLSNNIVIDTNNAISSIGFNGINQQIDSSKMRWRMYVDQSSSNDFLGIDSFNGVTPYNYMTYSNFSIGINKANPTGRLHIMGSTVAGGLDGTETSNNPLTIEDNSGSALRIVHLNTHVYDSTIYNYESTKNVFWGETTDTGGYFFRGKNVMIGNSNPDKALCIGSGTSDMTSVLKMNTGDCDKIYLTNSNNGSKISHASNWVLSFDAGQSNTYNGIISFKTGSNHGYLERMRVDTNGNVGINTSNPMSTLHIMGEAHSERAVTIDGSKQSVAYLSIIGQHSQPIGLEIDNSWIIQTSNNTDLLITHSNGTIPLQIQFNGSIYVSCNIGIGYSNPESPLHVHSLMQIGTQTITQGPSESTLSLRGNNQEATRQWNFKVGATSNTVSDYNTQRFRLLDSNVERLTIDNAGFVGINNNNPLSLLHIKSVNSNIQILESTSTNRSAYMQFKSLNDSLCYIGMDGQGLLNRSPGGLIMGTWNDYDMLFCTSNQERLCISSNGNIGINSSNPTSTLTVHGSITTKDTAWQDQLITLSNSQFELQGGHYSACLFQCYVEPPRQGIHFESKGSKDPRQIINSNTPMPFYINTELRGATIIGGNLYPNMNNSNSSLGLSTNQWTNVYASNSYFLSANVSNSLLVSGKITTCNDMTLTKVDDTNGGRIMWKRHNAPFNWYMKGPDWTSNARLRLGYSSDGITDTNVVTFDNGNTVGWPARGIVVNGGITAASNSTFQSTLTASNFVNQTYYSVTANVTTYHQFSTTYYGPGTVANIIEYTPVTGLTYNIPPTPFKNFIPPVTGLWRVDALLVWPTNSGSQYGISLVKNHYGIFSNSMPGGIIIDWYKIGSTGQPTLRPTSTNGTDYRFTLSGCVYLTTSDSVSTVVGYTGTNQPGTNINSFQDCKITFTLIQRTI